MNQRTVRGRLLRAAKGWPTFKSGDRVWMLYVRPNGWSLQSHNIQRATSGAKSAKPTSQAKSKPTNEWANVALRCSTTVSATIIWREKILCIKTSKSSAGRSVDEIENENFTKHKPKWNISKLVEDVVAIPIKSLGRGVSGNGQTSLQTNRCRWRMMISSRISWGCHRLAWTVLVELWRIFNDVLFYFGQGQIKYTSGQDS